MIYIVGIGPGDEANMTLSCRVALDRAAVIVGYTKYVELIKPLYPNKRYVSTGMTGEVERCKAAIELAKGGEIVAVICSGDAGVYGMAGLIFELAEVVDIEIEVVAGVTAATAGAALLGAPLGHDFCVISLSDLLTPWEVIKKRLICAAQADFCIVLYNPSSKNRSDYLGRACALLLQDKAGETVCGIAKNIGRDGQRCEVMTLAQLREHKADMFSTVFIGNSQTCVINGKMVTPRGYLKE